MMKMVFCAFLLLAGCSQQSEHKLSAAPTNASAVRMAGQSKMANQSKTPLMIPIPKDKAQLQRLLAMGYTIHEDHLHAPGVTSCPKMSENPVQ